MQIFRRDLFVDGFADDDCDAGAPDFGPTAEELAAFHAEGVSPETLDPDGDDGGDEDIGTLALDDAFKAAFEGHQVARAGDLAFREDGDEFTGFDLLAGFGERGERFAGRGWGDGDAAEEVENRLKGALVDGLPDEEADPARRGGADDDGVGVGDVVGDDQRAGGFGKAFRADDADAKEDMQRAP